MIYSFAGCIMEGAPFLQPFLPNGVTSIRGMSSEGVLRLLSGDALAIEESQLQRILNKHPHLSSDYGTYYGITKISAIVWTPVSDAIYLTPLVRCRDKTTYPFYDGLLDDIFGTTSASLSIAVIKSLWAQLHKETVKIRQRAVVYYPTDHLHSGTWKDRIDTIQQLARKMFSDWQHYTVDPELGDDGYWAHYSKPAIVRLWEQVRRGVQFDHLQSS